LKLLKVDTIEEAREKLISKARLWHLKTETVKLDEALLRILSEDIYSPCDIPSFRRSTIDGYAVLAADTAAAGDAIPVFLKEVGSVSMGKPACFSIRSGECAYVPTGAMLPAGADAVVMIEYCESAGENICVYEAVAPGTGTADTGEDMRKGNLLLKSGTKIGAKETGALAAAGICSIPVFSPIDICIISSGDELAPPEKEPSVGEIRDVNTHVLKALAKNCGYRVVSNCVLPDDERQLETAVRDALVASDVVVISGGSSKGEKDYTAAIIDRVTKQGVFTSGLAVKPGKPTILGWDDENKTLLAGLPGHPVSAMMVFQILLGWLIEKLFNRKPPIPVPAQISCNVPGSPGKTLLLPVALFFQESSCYAQPVFGKSGMIVTLTKADGYIIIDMNKEGLKKDERVLVHLF